MTDYPRIMRHDPARSHLLQLGIFYGFKGVGGPFCAISPKERDRLCEILQVEAQDIICLNCGCTKSDRWLQIQGMKSCCDNRDVVPAAQVAKDLQALKCRGKPARAELRLRWLRDEIAAGNGINGRRLMRKFGCSRDTARRDIARLIATLPNALVYDASAKVHRPAEAGEMAA